MRRKMKRNLTCILVTAAMILSSYYNFTTVTHSQQQLYPLQKEPQTMKVATVRTVKSSKLKTILLWTSPETEPFSSMGSGSLGFIDRKCPHTNCFVTSKRNFRNVEDFDVIAFNAPEVIGLRQVELPLVRTTKQKYVFVSIEPATRTPIHSSWLDDFFNWTWTYRLDSHIQFGSIIVRLKNGTIISPRNRIKWLRTEDMDPVPKKIKNELITKWKAVAWVVSNCSEFEEGVLVAKRLHTQLKLYNLTLDIFGVNCGSTCGVCWETIKKEYYFYLSFEDYLCDDYVTDRLMDAISSNAIPIVYGGADYSRFMPDGMYLNVKDFDLKKLAAKIYDLIRNPRKYYEYFKWTNHYYFHLSSQRVDTNEYCKICEMLNDENRMYQTTSYKYMRDYWNDMPIYMTME